MTGVYLNCHHDQIALLMPLKLLELSGSVGILDIPASCKFVAISLKFPGVGGRTHLSICEVISAVATCWRAAFLAVSLALPLADASLGISAAARIPMITITISISTNVNPFLIFLVFIRKIEDIKNFFEIR